MNTSATETPRVIDLTAFVFRGPGSEYSRHNRDGLIYRAIKSDAPDDVYTVLGIDPETFSVFVAPQKPVEKRNDFAFDRRSIWGHSDQPAILEPGKDVLAYIERKSNHAAKPWGWDNMEEVHMVLPGAYKPHAILFGKNGTDRGHDGCLETILTMASDQALPHIHIICSESFSEQVFGFSLYESRVEVLGVSLTAAYPDAWYRCRYETSDPTLSLGLLLNLQQMFHLELNQRTLMLLLKKKDGMTGKHLLVPQGNKAVLERLTPFYEELVSQEDQVFLVAVFQTLVSECKRTINSVKVSKWFNDFFADARDFATFKGKLEEVYATCAHSEPGGYWYYKFENYFAKFPGYAALRKTAVKSQSGRALAVLIAEVESLGYNRATCPILDGLIEDGSIPVSTFFRAEKEEAHFLFNDNWELLEEFLGKHREVGIQLAQLASKRTTYEKSFMSYIYFVLYELPEYLEKHTGKKWTCIPSIVDSPSELEPAKGVAGQTTKKRSALTPIVDNEKCTVIVPYACLKIPGVSTTYTYSLNYTIVCRGLSVDGNVCTKDIEEKLNGRDDYGLMFYTLTGTDRGRGNPSFLIIFERLDGRTQVHFHRSHPLRSKDGDKNPVNNWIRTCYNWMVGNVNLAGVKVQQGDLVFVAVDTLPEGERSQVDSFDSHAFEAPVTYIPCTKKDAQNILGYFEISLDTMLTHPEHRVRLIPAGLYELRQCRSWEANPKGVWTLRID